MARSDDDNVVRFLVTIHDTLKRTLGTKLEVGRMPEKVSECNYFKSEAAVCRCLSVDEYRFISVANQTTPFDTIVSKCISRDGSLARVRMIGPLREAGDHLIVGIRFCFHL